MLVSTGGEAQVIFLGEGIDLVGKSFVCVLLRQELM